jgi:hypothetical protein
MLLAAGRSAKPAVVKAPALHALPPEFRDRREDYVRLTPKPCFRR